MTSSGIRKQPRQARALDKRDRILDAAQALIHSNGYGKMSVADIARACGVGKPTIYQLYADKEAILAALADRRAEKIDLAVKHAMFRGGGDGWQALIRSLVRASYDVVRADPSLDSVFAAVLTVPKLRERDRLQMRERGRMFAILLSQLANLPVRPEFESIGVAASLVTISIGRHALQYDNGFEEDLLFEAETFILARLSIVMPPEGDSSQ
jgi:AcrR family transcriptional regulator